jgi:hypothetical protein
LESKYLRSYWLSYLSPDYIDYLTTFLRLTTFYFLFSYFLAILSTFSYLFATASTISYFLIFLLYYRFFLTFLRSYWLFPIFLFFCDRLFPTFLFSYFLSITLIISYFSIFLRSYRLPVIDIYIVNLSKITHTRLAN